MIILLVFTHTSNCKNKKCFLINKKEFVLIFLNYCTLQAPPSLPPKKTTTNKNHHKQKNMSDFTAIHFSLKVISIFSDTIMEKVKMSSVSLF